MLSNPAKPAIYNTQPLPHVRRVVAVASGKGGVGKSTITVQLALMLQAIGLRVGIPDADIYGPSIPRMLGLSGHGQPVIESGLMQPVQGLGLKAMSMGFITGDNAAILRGPLISKTLQQLARMTNWGSEAAPLDLLLLDMPPGTGDVHLSMAQQVPINGAIIITTPQQIAVIDARKAVQMFQKLHIPLLGIIENMSAYIDAQGNKIAMFGEGGGAQLAEQAGTKLLGQIPLLPELGICADNGANLLQAQPASLAISALEAIALQLRS